MITIYKYERSIESVLVGEYPTQSGHKGLEIYEAIRQYVKSTSINGKMESFEYLGELHGTVYRMSFEMTLNGKKNEYFLIKR